MRDLVDLDPSARWVDDVVGVVAGVSIGAVINAGMGATVPRNKQLAVFGLLAAVAIVYLSYKHRRDAAE